jgi:catalase
LTKVWPHADYPLIPVGKLVLDRNPNNYFADVEQIAFSPSHLVLGIEPSPDKMLQGRLFSYPDTHRHRLGANYLQLPVNCPFRVCMTNYQRDGPQMFCDQGGAPNYYPNSFGGPEPCHYTSLVQNPLERIRGDVNRFESGLSEDNFAQASVFFTKTLDEEARQRLVTNIVDHLKNASTFIQERAVRNFGQVNGDFGRKLRVALKLEGAEIY